MREDAQPRYYAPRTHDLTLGELRAYLKSVESVPDDFFVRCKNSTPFQVFEFIKETRGVEVFHTTKTINLPID
jgi:hypothetical protein